MSKKNDTTKQNIDNSPAPVDSAASLETWFQLLHSQTQTPWEKLPDIDLYMDQVLTLMERQLKPYKRTDKDTLLTSSMINNYMKDNLLPRAVDKKYDRRHLVLLSVLGALKPVLSLSDLRILLPELNLSQTPQELYQHFESARQGAICDCQEKVNQQITAMTEREGAENRMDLLRLAFDLSLHASVQLATAQKILDILKGEGATNE